MLTFTVEALVHPDRVGGRRRHRQEHVFHPRESRLAAGHHPAVAHRQPCDRRELRGVGERRRRCPAVLLTRVRARQARHRLALAMTFDGTELTLYRMERRPIAMSSAPNMGEPLRIGNGLPRCDSGGRRLRHGADGCRNQPPLHREHASGSLGPTCPTWFSCRSPLAVMALVALFGFVGCTNRYDPLVVEDHVLPNGPPEAQPPYERWSWRRCRSPTGASRTIRPPIRLKRCGDLRDSRTAASG